MNLVSQSELETESAFQDNNINITGYKKALFLQSIFRENDLVFIRFEKLKSEKDEFNTEYNENKYDPSLSRVENERKYSERKEKKIKGKYWDMIGLIDTTSIDSTYNTIRINIIGRDLIKLLIEDYNFFIPIQFGNTPETIFGGGDTKIFNRLFTSGEYNLEFIKSFRSIENSIGFILSQLTNTQILSPACLELLKKEYGEDLSKQFEYTQGGKNENIQEGKNKKQAVINGVWGLVNYYVDENISHYRLADASLKSPDGSVLQQIHKVCQEPFVEIIADTFVDKFSLILRRPPFTIEDIAKQKFIIIGKESTITESLVFNQNISTIYQLIPQGGCFINNNSIPLAYLPMIVLDEYTKMWGSKLYSQVFNYINIDAYTKVEEKNEKQSSIKESFIDALIWLIESSAYLPFSRTGTITIRGDRRIKIGQWIYFEKSNEIFYVEGVQHSVNISGNNLDRRTVLKVSRGLVKDYIFPKRDISSSSQDGFQKSKVKSVSYSNISYGDLIDINYLKEGLKELFIKLNKDFNIQRLKKDGNKYFKTNSIVINEVFNFFLSGAQFEGAVKPFIKNYEVQPAVELNDLNRLQKGEESYHLYISDGSDNNNGNGSDGLDNQNNIGNELPKVKGYQKVGNPEIGYKFIPIYE